MNFELTEEQRSVRDMVAAFAAREIAPHAGRWDRESTFPLALYAKLGELGIMGMSASEAYGGAALDTVSMALAIEELSRADAGVGVTVSVHAGLITRIIEQFASPELRAEYLQIGRASLGKECRSRWSPYP